MLIVCQVRARDTSPGIRVGKHRPYDHLVMNPINFRAIIKWPPIANRKACWNLAWNDFSLRNTIGAWFCQHDVDSVACHPLESRFLVSSKISVFRRERKSNIRRPRQCLECVSLNKQATFDRRSLVSRVLLTNGNWVCAILLNNTIVLKPTYCVLAFPTRSW